MTTPDASQPDNAPLAALVETLLAGLPPALTAAVRLAALPRHLTDATLTLLLADPMVAGPPAVTVDAVKVTLVSTHLARQDGATLSFHPELRTTLLHWWRQRAPEQFVAHNRRLLDFWRDKAKTSPAPEEIDIVYHALAVDEEAGRLTLLTTFETALDYFQVEQAEALVAAARTLTPWLNETMRPMSGSLRLRRELPFISSSMRSMILLIKKMSELRRLPSSRLMDWSRRSF